MPLEVRSLAEWEADGVPGLLSVVIPAHNEEGHIADTVRGLHAALAAAGVAHEILVVNDNSRDRHRGRSCASCSAEVPALALHQQRAAERLRLRGPRRARRRSAATRWRS